MKLSFSFMEWHALFLRGVVAVALSESVLSAYMARYHFPRFGNVKDMACMVMLLEVVENVWSKFHRNNLLGRPLSA